MGNAARVRDGLGWRPGAFCDVKAFTCSTWYPGAAEWLVHREWRVIPGVTHGFGEVAKLAERARGLPFRDRPIQPILLARVAH